jgi:hypothetical protein
MDTNLQQINTLTAIVDGILNQNAATILLQAAQIQDLKAQIADLSVPVPGITFSNLERLSLWTQAGTSGNSGGGDPNAPPIGVMTPGAPATFKTQTSIPYNNPYWYLKLAKIVPTIMSTTKFAQSLQWRFMSQADLDVCQAVEFEIQQHIGLEIYNMAWQMPLKEKFSWCAFNYETKKFEPLPTPIPVDMSLIAPGKWISIVAEHVRDPKAKTITHTALTINGHRIPVNLTRAASISTVSAQSTNVGFQLDTNNKPINYSVQAQNFNVVAS